MKSCCFGDSSRLAARDDALGVGDVDAGDALAGEEGVDVAVGLGGVGEGEAVRLPVGGDDLVGLLAADGHEGRVRAVLGVALLQQRQLSLAVGTGGREEHNKRGLPPQVAAAQHRAVVHRDGKRRQRHTRLDDAVRGLDLRLLVHHGACRKREADAESECFIIHTWLLFTIY